MQKLKNDIRQELLKAAEELFLRKGFQKTSMREIAEVAQVGLGNIYNYFSGKDDLFCTIVYPVTHAFERMLEKHHGPLRGGCHGFVEGGISPGGCR